MTPMTPHRDFVEITDPDRAVCKFEDSEGQQRLVYKVFLNQVPNNGKRKHTVQVYDGPPGEERLVRTWWACGHRDYHEGPKGEERLVRRKVNHYPDVACMNPEVDEQFFEGPKGEERLVRATLVDAFYCGVETECYEGKAGEERLVRITRGDWGGDTVFEGEPGKERKVRDYRLKGDIEGKPAAVFHYTYDEDGKIHVADVIEEEIVPSGEEPEED